MKNFNKEVYETQLGRKISEKEFKNKKKLNKELQNKIKSKLQENNKNTKSYNYKDFLIEQKLLNILNDNDIHNLKQMKTDEEKENYLKNLRKEIEKNIDNDMEDI